MVKNIPKPIRQDAENAIWMVDHEKTTWYPNGMINKLYFKNGLNQRKWVRYDEAGNPIGGDLSLAY